MRHRELWLCLGALLCLLLATLLKPYALNQGDIAPMELLRPLLYCLVACLLLVCLLRLYFGKQPVHIALTLGVLLLLQSFFGKFDSLVSRFAPSFSGTGGEVLLWFVLTLAPLPLLRKKSIPPSLAAPYFVFSLTLLLLSAFPLLSSRRPNRVKPQAATLAPTPPQQRGTLTEKPNLYVIVLDAYARQDKLQEIYGFDNSPFLGALTERGFFVAKNSHSNYCYTCMSIPVLLNMAYPEDIPLQKNINTLTPLWAKETITQNATASYLKALGYRFIAINSGCLFTEPRDAQMQYSPYAKGSLLAFFTSPISYLEMLLIDRTALRVVQWDSTAQYDQHRDNLRHAVESLSAAADQPGPKFVFAHILCPHFPYVFDNKGKAIRSKAKFTMEENLSEDNSNKAETKQQYKQQLEFISTKTLQQLDLILQKDPTALVVVLSDHGSRYKFHQSDLAKIDVEECFSNLVAIRIPKADLSGHDDISVVNVLRLVLKTQFDPTIPLLPNRMFFVHSGNATEVTQQLLKRK